MSVVEDMPEIIFLFILERINIDSCSCDLHFEATCHSLRVYYKHHMGS